jgi:hypothetical protein
MQNASTLAGIDPVLLSLGPVPQGEIARIIREPSEVLRRKAGPFTPIFDTAIVERLQNEIAGEMDALPLLAFVLQRSMAATLVGRRPNNAVSQGRCLVPWILA